MKRNTRVFNLLVKHGEYLDFLVGMFSCKVTVEFRADVASHRTKGALELALDSVTDVDMNEHFADASGRLFTQATVPWRTRTDFFRGRQIGGLHPFDFSITRISHDDLPRWTVRMFLSEMVLDVLLLPVIIDAVSALVQLGSVHFQMVPEGIHRQFIIVVLTVRTREDGVLVKCLQVIFQHAFVDGQVATVVVAAHVTLMIRNEDRLLRLRVVAAGIASRITAHPLFGQRFVFDARTVRRLN